MQMLEADPAKRITARKLREKFVSQDCWAAVREGNAVREC